MLACQGKRHKSAGSETKEFITQSNNCKTIIVCSSSWSLCFHSDAKKTGMLAYPLGYLTEEEPKSFSWCDIHHRERNYLVLSFSLDRYTSLSSRSLSYTFLKRQFRTNTVSPVSRHTKMKRLVENCHSTYSSNNGYTVQLQLKSLLLLVPEIWGSFVTII